MRLDAEVAARHALAQSINLAFEHRIKSMEAAMTLQISELNSAVYGLIDGMYHVNPTAYSGEHHHSFVQIARKVDLARKVESAQNKDDTAATSKAE